MLPDSPRSCRGAAGGAAPSLFREDLSTPAPFQRSWIQSSGEKRSNRLHLKAGAAVAGIALRTRKEKATTARIRCERDIYGSFQSAARTGDRNGLRARGFDAMLCFCTFQSIANPWYLRLFMANHHCNVNERIFGF